MAPLTARLQRKLFQVRYLRNVDQVVDVRTANPDFDETVRAIRESGTDDLAYFGNQYSHAGGLYLQQNPDEFAALVLWLRARAPIRNYLEIGSASGGACVFLTQRLTIDRSYSIDDGKHPRAVEQDRLLGQVDRLERHVGDSHAPGARRFLENTVRGPLDLAFVDGDHSYEGVLQDIQLTLEFSRPGTWLVLHDTVACEPVQRAWHEGLRKRWFTARTSFVGNERPLGIAIVEVV